MSAPQLRQRNPHAITRRRWPIAVLTCVAVGGALGLATACGSSSPYRPPTATGSPAGAAPAATIASIGQSVTDGNYSFVVNRMQCGVGTLTSEFETGTPTQGQFCVAVLTMTNVTNAPQTTPPSGTLTDTNGNTYDMTTDGSAITAAEDVYLGANFNVQLEVNPGSHYTDVYVYDVPRGVQASTLTLPGSWSLTDTGTKVSVVGGQAAAPASSAPASSAPAAPAPAAPPPSTANASGPQAVVQAYFAAIDAGNYALAWSLGGKNIENGSYDSFVQGFSGTSYDAVTVLSVNGDTVSVDLDATQTDGTHKYFSGTYTVQNGVIVGADIH